METRANHVLIGGFVLLVIAALFGFVIWLAKVEIDREFTYYDIYFEAPISGLNTASQVRFNGIPVGSVTEIAIVPDDLTRVRVTVEVSADTPIKQDSIAVIQMQGITGVSLVSISGGSQDSPALAPAEGQPRAVIASAPSAIEELFQGAPQLINRGIVLVNRAAELLNDDNRAAMTDILTDINTLTRRLASRADALDRIIDAADHASANVVAATDNINDLSGRLIGLSDDVEQTMAVVRGTFAGVDAVVEKDLRASLNDLAAAARSLEETGNAVTSLVDDNREGLQAFAGEGLNQFSRFIAEARLLVSSISRITQRIEDDPARFIFGTEDSEYHPEQN
jgi:phospholipid/cholesterol/gamma-HCH transport system substrate-binding protein